jgi:hypothetical protein
VHCYLVQCKDRTAAGKAIGHGGNSAEDGILPHIVETIFGCCIKKERKISCKCGTHKLHGWAQLLGEHCRNKLKNESQGQRLELIPTKKNPPGWSSHKSGIQEGKRW